MRDWGLVTPSELERIVVVSPHLDDAVLGCGRLLAAHPNATVITVYAGAPSPYPDPPTSWDQLAGFGPGDDVLARRRGEDERALAELDATPVWLDFVEHQYLERPDWVGADQTVDTLEAAIRDAPAHRRSSCRSASRIPTTPRPTMRPGRCASASGLPVVVLLPGHGLPAHPRAPRMAGQPAVPGGDLAHPGCSAGRSRRRREGRARSAHYASQLRALEADWQLGPKLAAPAPEQFWRLAPPPPGWERLSQAG